MTGVLERRDTTTEPVAGILSRVIGRAPDLRVEAFDGSHSGPDDASVTLRVDSPRALARLVSAPGSLGLARAYVTQEIDIDGDLYTALSAMAEVTLHSIPRREQLWLARRLLPYWREHRMPPPDLEARPRGLLHSKRRDSQAISHHYDVSNRFYEFVLGESMTYTCAAYPHADATLEEAQANKYALVAAKLDLQPGTALLDVGCGWGGMVRHAAAEHGVKALGVTLSREQAAWGQAEIERQGLGGLAEIRHLDYRDLPDGAFDAVSSIGLTEHIGKANIDTYFRAMQAKLRPGGRMLNHCITQPYKPDHRNTDPFIHRYVFPDGELEPIGTLVTAMNEAGFEIRHAENLREHYALTLRDWGTNLDRNWTDAVAEVGIGRARVWRLYMAACRLGFELNNIQLHQVLGVKLHADGSAGFPLRGEHGAY
ncbi:MULTISPECIES: SAM-dependent methyltransferase [Pseudonocardia]|uniref:Cyclopropane-fatty-acyl-phospholipid synthase n=2 Tax=Pseudonocardia TaxID=1847 RepID=A0A1Y2MZQ3_PSEAH|nr:MULTISPECIES: cyclopropane-fatty-acyl-phospholipid synthase family protein [Pseudonocardia]OSY40449.1 Cyclopropane-fatty-acyl-phospholipid synthase [Pseudonocardia autotrophica]TDN72222.1 cyclopropane-fatty-acyl-phospholipid synthase [Pseudonocardia autotrophica]BBG02931.1 cyclopropane-fatty-acyl-phospholipid synthase [Pseudonocardia autotrophica]GEC25167.1 cyclopropane-fatty-acyl-phospholipid synthase [Pseudonocardia saturnea]